MRRVVTMGVLAVIALLLAFPAGAAALEPGDEIDAVCTAYVPVVM